MSIQHRPEKRRPWVARIRTPDGRQKSRSFSRKVDAIAWVEDERSRIRRGDWIDPRRGEVLWEAYAAQVLDSKQGLSPRTVETYEAAARRVAPYLEGHTLAAITPERLDQVIADLSREYAPETVAKSVRLLRMVFGRAVIHQRLTRSPAVALSAPRVPKREMRILSPEEVSAVAEELPGRYRTIPITAAFMGMRFGELAGLQTSAVDFDRRRLEVRQVLKEPRGQTPYLGPPKSAAGARTLAMPRTLAGELTNHLLEWPPANGFVWTAVRGDPLRRGSFSRIWRDAVDGSIGRPCRLHDLRHTHAAWLIAAGEHPKTIQQRLGHASITVTLDRYGHLMEGLDEGAADKLDSLFSGERCETVEGQRRGQKTAHNHKNPH